MNYSRRHLVGIKAPKNYGKDTIASMIHYIKAVGISRASFDRWEVFNKNVDDEMIKSTIHFADKLKDDLSAVFGISRTLFDLRGYKDEKYYCFDTNTFCNAKIAELGGRMLITNETLTNGSLATILQLANNKCAITLRTLMQYYGTELIRNKLSDKAWINVGINKAYTTMNYYGYAIIADVRFINESNAIYENGGKVIRITKGDKEKTSTEHSSEHCYIDERDYIIDNSGNLLGLFYKVIEFVQKEML